ncbi:hypothetical protein JZU48_03855, partial [bacterium]|nr:hypothetical protein [bacterium]
MKSRWVWGKYRFGARFSAAALLAAVVCSAAHDARAQALRLAYVEFPPYTYTDGGVGRGSLIEMFDKVARDAALAYTAEAAPARRLFQGVVDGEFNVFLGIKSVPAFEGAVIASAAPIARIELNAYAVGAAPS